MCQNETQSSEGDPEAEVAVAKADSASAVSNAVTPATATVTPATTVNTVSTVNGTWHGSGNRDGTADVGQVSPQVVDRIFHFRHQTVHVT